MTTSWREEVAWAAGFFDGEGYVGTRLQDGIFVLQIDVPQVDRRVLDRLRAAVGIGKVYGPYLRRSRFSQQPRFEYRADHHAQVIPVVALLWEFLSAVKRAQASAAFGVSADSYALAPGQPRSRSVCQNGHRKTSANTRTMTGRGGYEYRSCRDCDREVSRRYRQRRLAHALLIAV